MYNRKGSGTAFDKVCVLLFAIIMIAFGFAGCGNTDSTEEETETLAEYGQDACYDYRDPETGVHYIIYNAYNRSGISVRYNADGSLYVD